MTLPPTRCERCGRGMPPGTSGRYCTRTCAALASVSARLPTGNRGQATGIGNFVIAIAVGAFMTWVIEMLLTFLSPLMKSQANDPVSNTAYQWSQTFLENTPAIFLFCAVLSLLALSIYQRAFLR